MQIVWGDMMADPRPLKVLVVDDNELTRSLQRLILRGGLYDVVGEAENAKTALEMAKSLHPNIVLLDNNMPGGKGIDIVPELRKTLPRAVILMVTTQSEQDMIDAAIARGASGFVIKPFNTQSLLNTIAEASRHFVLADPAQPKY
jgi:two-component system chemotaxis response regulator CheY